MGPRNRTVHNVLRLDKIMTCPQDCKGLTATPRLTRPALDKAPWHPLAVCGLCPDSLFLPICVLAHSSGPLCHLNHSAPHSWHLTHFPDGPAGTSSEQRSTHHAPCPIQAICGLVHLQTKTLFSPPSSFSAQCIWGKA